jgi:hypothetical protein
VAAVTTLQLTLLPTVEGEVIALLCDQFKSNLQLLVDTIRLKQRGNSKFSFIVFNIIYIMSLFVNFKVKFVGTHANSVVYALVKVVNSSTSFHKLEFIPFYTERLLINETH